VTVTLKKWAPSAGKLARFVLAARTKADLKTDAPLGQAQVIALAGMSVS